MDRFIACFEGLEDPQTGNAGLHDFYELLVIVLCGGQGATRMAAFAAAKEPFLRGFLKLEHGIPSYGTFSRLFRLLDPERFRAAFQRFMAKFSETYQASVLALPPALPSCSATAGSIFPEGSRWLGTEGRCRNRSDRWSGLRTCISAAVTLLGQPERRRPADEAGMSRSCSGLDRDRQPEDHGEAVGDAGGRAGRCPTAADPAGRAG